MISLDENQFAGLKLPHLKDNEPPIGAKVGPQTALPASLLGGASISMGLMVTMALGTTSRMKARSRIDLVAKARLRDARMFGKASTRIVLRGTLTS